MDLNGDGDLSDVILHLHDVDTGITTNLQFAMYLDTYFWDWDTMSMVIGDDVMAFYVKESSQGTDLNGDGDQFDSVAFLFDLVTGQKHEPWSRDGNKLLQTDPGRGILGGRAKITSHFRGSD